MTLSELKIDKGWTLFLDRDGVINLHYPNDYVKSWDEFYFLEGSLDALTRLAKIFRRIIVVTNQQGVGRGLMTHEDLEFIHDEMLKEVRKHGGHINAIYTATDLKENDVKQMRKPEIGMAKRAKKDFTEIEFAKSIMVGDSISDMQFGRSAGMITIFVGDVHKLSDQDKSFIDIFTDSISTFAAALS
jgi:histidinol-phosphate phosphatase family protein